MLLFKTMQSYCIKCNPRFSAEQAGLHHSQLLLGFLVHGCRLLSRSICEAISYDGTRSFRITNLITLLAPGLTLLHQGTCYRYVKAESKQCQSRITHSTKCAENVRAQYRPARVAKTLSELLEVIPIPGNEDEAHSKLRSLICSISSHRILHIFYSVIFMN